MKAIAHRRLTPVLALLCVVSAAWLVALVCGEGRGVHWRAFSPVVALPVVSHSEIELTAPPLDAMKVAWERPLFDPNRRMVSAPAPVADTAVAKLAGLVLTGTVLAGPLQVALIKDASGKDVRVPVGGSHQGWMLISLESRRAVFRNGEATDDVIFPAPDANSAGARVAKSNATLPSHDAASQNTPMMTVDAGGKIPPSDPLDDVAARQARLEALKDLVARRRAESSDEAGGQ